MKTDIVSTINVLTDVLQQAELTPAAVDLESLRKVYAALSRLWGTCETLAGLRDMTLPVFAWQADKTNNILYLVSVLSEKPVLSVLFDGTLLIDSPLLEDHIERGTATGQYLDKVLPNTRFLETRQRLFREKLTAALRADGIPVLGQHPRLCTWPRGTLCWDEVYTPIPAYFVPASVRRVCGPLLSLDPYKTRAPIYWMDALAHVYEGDTGFYWIAWDNEEEHPFGAATVLAPEEDLVKRHRGQLLAGLIGTGSAETYEAAAQAALVWLQTKGWRLRLALDSETTKLL